MMMRICFPTNVLGIYIGDEQVIHFSPPPPLPGSFSYFSGSFSDASSVARIPCTKCDSHSREGVTQCCLDCFLSGGELCRLQYNVSRLFFFSRVRAGTCSLAKSSPPAVILHRAKYLLECNGFGRYDFLRNNCEHFAIYCSTCLISQKPLEVGQVGALKGFLERLYKSRKLKVNGILRNLLGFQSGLAESLLAFLQSVFGSKIEETVMELARGLFGESGLADAVGKEILEFCSGKMRVSPSAADASALLTNIYAELFILYYFYSVARYQSDIGIRCDVRSIDVERLVAELNVAEPELVAESGVAGSGSEPLAELEVGEPEPVAASKEAGAEFVADPKMVKPESDMVDPEIVED
uniref:LRAT domain-containing protein n=1 Tax=Nelumbo nucifera TaxID=4432 RepID=A0A822YBW1_NELNU|nr:TPA_asm: hypothetical protein HUJ06_031548 [Nelumbo nucifera]